MPTPKTLNATFRPTRKENGSPFWVTSYWLFDDPDKIVVEFTVTTPAELALAIKDKADNLGAPTIEGADETAWSVSVRPTTSRWPNGFKKMFGSNSIVRPAPLPEVV